MGKNEANVCLIAHNVFNIPEHIINNFFRRQFNDVYNENKKNTLCLSTLYTKWRPGRKSGRRKQPARRG